MKILLVIHFFPPKHNSGSENATYNLARELAKRHEVTVFTSEPDTEQDGFIEDYREDNFRVVKVHQKMAAPFKIEDNYINEKMDAIFEHYLDEVKPNVVHIQHLIILSLNFIELAKERNIPVIHTLHDFWFECPQIKKFYDNQNCRTVNGKDCAKCLQEILPSVTYQDDGSGLSLVSSTIAAISRYLKKGMENSKLLKKMVYAFSKKSGLGRIMARGKNGLIEKRKGDFLKHYSLVDLFISPSEFLRRDAINFGIPKTHIVTVPHGIPVPKPYPSQTKVQEVNPKRKITFCFMSHLILEKGIFLLIKSFKELSKEFGNARLVLYGAFDRSNQRIKNMFEEIKEVDAIEYRGEFNNSEIGKILSEVDVTVVPSLWNEIYGLVLDESFLYGVPVIVSRRGALPERVSDRENGFVFDPDKKGDLLRRLESIMKDPNILSYFRKNIPTVKSMEKYAQEIEGIYSRFV